MTVAELIEQLREVPQDAEVVSYDSEWGAAIDITGIALVDGQVVI